MEDDWVLQGQHAGTGGCLQQQWERVVTPTAPGQTGQEGTAAEEQLKEPQDEEMGASTPRKLQATELEQGKDRLRAGCRPPGHRARAGREAGAHTEGSARGGEDLHTRGGRSQGGEDLHREGDLWG